MGWISVYRKHWITLANVLMFMKINLATLGALYLLHSIVGTFKSEYAFLNTISESYHFNLENIIFITLAISFIIFLVDGFFINTFLRATVSLQFDKNTKVVIKPGDIFEQNGCIIIPVNDLFFDTVDDDFVASSSLHGQMLKRFWGGQTNHWYDGAVKEFEQYSPEGSIEYVTAGNLRFRKFPIGFTAKIATDTGKKFLCVALTHTDPMTKQCDADMKDLYEALNEALDKARYTCSNQPLNLPLMGNGLARIGMRPILLLYFILGVIEKSINSKNHITEEINIVLPSKVMSGINLSALKKDWSKYL